jgi:hypothetical protein
MFHKKKNTFVLCYSGGPETAILSNIGKVPLLVSAEKLLLRRSPGCKFALSGASLIETIKFDIKSVPV